jgi:hypothetical protein
MLSFSMFLLLSLNETRLTRKHVGECNHSIHRNQLTCFAKGDLVSFFKVSPIIYRWAAIGLFKLDDVDKEPRLRRIKIGFSIRMDFC